MGLIIDLFAGGGVMEKMKRACLFLVLALVALAGCRSESTTPMKATIVAVYQEERWGAPDGTTVVQFADGSRARVVGMLGKPGEPITVYFNEGSDGSWVGTQPRSRQ